MPSFKKTISIGQKTAEQIYEFVDRDLEKFLSKAPLGKVEIKRDAKAKKVMVESSMFTGTLECKDGELIIDAKLSLLASPFKSKLEEGLEHWTKKNFS